MLFSAIVIRQIFVLGTSNWDQTKKRTRESINVMLFSAIVIRQAFV